MATKTEFKKILKEFNLTEEQFQKIYEDVATTNKLVNNLLNITKIKLQDLAPHLLRQLPTQKEKDLKAQEEERIKKEIEEQEKIKSEQKAKYLEDHYEEIILNKIDSGEKLTETELQQLRWEYSAVWEEEGENRRWSQTIESVLLIGGRHFMLVWERGLTENQPNEFYNQPYEVKENSYEKTITIVEWLPINKGE